MKRLVVAAVAALLVLVAGCSSGGSDQSPKTSEPPTNDEIASQIEAAYVPAKACWDSFRDASCPSVYATVQRSLAGPYEALQKQGGREQSVREIAAAEQKWNDWLERCIDDYTAVRNASFCLQERPTSGDLDEAVSLVRQGK
ncbi:hypothetical protein [Williamsia serinedens]|uniref:hypothetical protein n=1 Tax=Williamsia serinedens TaxID=391736 RepID=UPI0020A33FFE|nr:hypothetical protein [Williamsia serinedens]